MSAPLQRKRRRAYVPQYLPPPSAAPLRPFVLLRRDRLRIGLVVRFRQVPSPIPGYPLRHKLILRRFKLTPGLVSLPRIGSTLVFVIAPAELDPTGATDDTTGLVDYRAATSRIKGQ